MGIIGFDRMRSQPLLKMGYSAIDSFTSFGAEIKALEIRAIRYKSRAIVRVGD